LIENRKILFLDFSHFSFAEYLPERIAKVEEENLTQYKNTDGT
jgi:hypothetical protein